VTVRPFFARRLFRFTLANRGFPGTSSFLGELLLFIGIYRANGFVLVLAATSIILSASYSTWLYNRLIFGTLKTQYIAQFTDLTRVERSILSLLVGTRLLLGFCSAFVTEYCDVRIKEILLKTSLLENRDTNLALRKVENYPSQHSNSIL